MAKINFSSKIINLFLISFLIITSTVIIFSFNYQFLNSTYDPSNEKRAVAFGLYGNKKLYTLGALKNAELVPEVYPGWDAVFFVDEKTVPTEIIAGLKERGAIVITNKKHNGNMFGRFMIADFEEYDRFIVRDADSRVSHREAKAVREWIESGELLNNIRDHEYHGAKIMGGLWGARKGFLKGKKMLDLAETWNSHKVKQDDQNFLAAIIWPLVGEENILSHDNFFCLTTPEHTMPLPRKANQSYAGQVVHFDENDQEYTKDNNTRLPDKNCYKEKKYRHKNFIKRIINNILSWLK
ncbi:MAG: hypothetical protein HRU35_06795 [Rickettsiaceae bacterium]|nr:hypothetical protein [Rickettsiaceae bacterium]